MQHFLVDDSGLHANPSDIFKYGFATFFVVAMLHLMGATVRHVPRRPIPVAGQYLHDGCLDDSSAFDSLSSGIRFPHGVD